VHWWGKNQVAEKCRSAILTTYETDLRTVTVIIRWPYILHTFDRVLRTPHFIESPPPPRAPTPAIYCILRTCHIKWRSSPAKGPSSGSNLQCESVTPLFLELLGNRTVGLQKPQVDFPAFISSWEQRDLFGSIVSFLSTRNSKDWFALLYCHVRPTPWNPSGRCTLISQQGMQS
jgi:hypothetical protein